MKRKSLFYGLALILLLSISVSSLPFSLLHHHEHKNDCDIAANIPDKFKKEKNQYPKHYHTHEALCFLCFENHLTNSYVTEILHKTNLISSSFTFTEKIFPINSISIVDLKGRDPPALLFV